VENSGTIAGLDGVSDTIGPADLAALSPLLAPNQPQPRTQPKPSSSTRDILVQERFPSVRASTLVETFGAMEDFAGFGRIKDGTLTPGEFDQVTEKLNSVMAKPLDEAVLWLRQNDRALKNKLKRDPTESELYQYYTRVTQVANQVSSVMGTFGELDGNPNISVNDVLQLQKKYPGVLAP